MRGGPHGHGRWRGASWHHPRGGYFDYGGPFYPWPVVDASLAIDQFFDPSQMVDPSQVFDPLFDSAQMVDLSRALPGPGVVGLYGMFEGDFLRGDPEPPPRPMGLLLLGARRKAWRPRRLVVGCGVVGAAPLVDCVARGDAFARGGWRMWP
jgi:hypothetical protein